MAKSKKFLKDRLELQYDYLPGTIGAGIMIGAKELYKLEVRTNCIELGFGVLIPLLGFISISYEWRGPKSLQRKRVAKNKLKSNQ